MFNHRQLIFDGNVDYCTRDRPKPLTFALSYSGRNSACLHPHSLGDLSATDTGRHAIRPTRKRPHYMPVSYYLPGVDCRSVHRSARQPFGTHHAFSSPSHLGQIWNMRDVSRTDISEQSYLHEFSSSVAPHCKMCRVESMRHCCGSELNVELTVWPGKRLGRDFTTVDHLGNILFRD